MTERNFFIRSGGLSVWSRKEEGKNGGFRHIIFTSLVCRRRPGNKDA